MSRPESLRVPISYLNNTRIGEADTNPGYLQAGVLVPYIALGPTIVAGGLTLGVLTQTTRAFGRVESSFQYLVQSWTTIVSLISIYKRLRAFEATLQDKPLDLIEAEAVPGLR